jgi:hypothetical protein
MTDREDWYTPLLTTTKIVDIPGIINGNSADSRLATAVSYTTNTTLDDDVDVVSADCTSGSLSFTLPDASTKIGNTYRFKRVDNAPSNSCTVLAPATDSIDGLSSLTIAPLGVVDLVAVSSNLWIIASGYRYFEDTTSYVEKFIPGWDLASAGSPPGTYTATGTGVKLLAFDDTTEEQAFGVLSLPITTARYDVSVLWLPTTTNVGDVRWGIEWIKADPGVVLGSATVAEANSTAPGTADQVTRVILGNTAGSNFPLVTDEDEKVIFRFYREAADAADTHTGDAALIGITVRAHVKRPVEYTGTPF